MNVNFSQFIAIKKTKKHMVLYDCWSDLNRLMIPTFRFSEARGSPVLLVHIGYVPNLIGLV
jgi:hypothetical protein